ncbi:MAG: DUF58 domain-containing protein [Kiritimatiellae bacterium]|nr:DUF58 domain-containing protein [Kiritimatiellia bacterium]
MLVPSASLLLWAALTALPSALLWALAPAARGVAWTPPATLAALALLDAVRARGRLQGIEAAVPDETRAFCDRDDAVELRLSFAAAARGRRLRVALALDDTLESSHEFLEARLPDEGAACVVRWPYRPRRRGRFAISQCAIETASPAGLWTVIARRVLRGAVRVYPNLREEHRRLAARFLRRRDLGGQLQRQTGKGREFEKLREYVQGDDPGDIHWKATARRGFPVTKLYQVERTQEIYVAIDTSRLTARLAPAPGEPSARSLLDRFIACGLLLALAAESQGDRFGLLAFDRQVHTFLGARRGKPHFESCRRALYRAQPAGVSPDYRELFVFLRARLPKRALILVLTCLDDAVLAEAMVEAMRLVARHHLVALTMLKPAGVAPLFGGADADSLDGLRARLAGHLIWQRLRETERSLRLLGAHTAQVEAEALAATAVTQYMTIKRRQLL